MVIFVKKWLLLKIEKENKTLIVIAGPTASGKTDLAIQISKEFNACIISADSRQIYRELNIGTAKPVQKILKETDHHFIDHISITTDYNAGTYEKEVIIFLENYFKAKNIAILCGGTGLYIDAVLNGLDSFPEINKETIAGIEVDLAEKGLAYLQNELKSCDPDYYNKVDLNNPHRLIRALSVCRETGVPFSHFLKKGNTEREFNVINLFLDIPRKQLYERINNRVDEMINAGLVEEAKHFYQFKDFKSLQTVGYRELFKYFDGLITWDEAVELIKRNTRRYAKRQLTWFNNKDSWIKINPSETDKIIDLIKNKINSN